MNFNGAASHDFGELESDSDWLQPEYGLLEGSEDSENLCQSGGRQIGMDYSHQMIKENK